ncbi:ACP S-malonyltransferase [Oecophyllibacter saccharovorans]|uniref:ACP S-malonyltransferase n=1 Tax=Oecophyllibacter saccharovorans TaxID=2558360 RepID=UPI001175BA3C|nr:ACP S-malonyltransferase [Oecophyllibacter saccharovorans]TPW35309.1 ACP S-malonyltransferase [Oecophyllibacter saccharovorans]
MMRHAFVFPGQGSQSVGMGRELAETFPAAREVFEEVDEALGQNLSRLMFEGEAQTLTATENAQPALFAVSLAVVRTLEREGGFSLPDKALLMAGHSLGEYAALAAAGVMGIAEGARLLRLRGQAMQRAVPAGLGSMAALLGIEVADAQKLCAEMSQGQVLEIANDNGGGQIVVSGHEAAVKRAMEGAKARGVRRVVQLPVSAPFHSTLMAPAAEEMAAALAQVSFKVPRVPVVANVTAAEVSNAEDIKRLLVQQVTGQVRWRETVLNMVAAGVTQQHELGAGKVLTGLARRIAPDMTADHAGTPAEIETLLKNF